MTVASKPATAQADAEIAVRVEHVSKTYPLWANPNSRLRYALASAALRTLPGAGGLKRRLRDRRARMYREFKALDDVSFEIRKGESWGIIGVNGSGKSTLLKIISGNLRPSAGRVEVDGKVARLDYSAGLNGAFTGRENVFLKAAIMGMPRREIERRYDSIVEFSEIGEFINQPVKTYSSGMQARLGFAIMAHMESEILISDEALAVGDAFFVQKCMRHIRSFLKNGTFLFVTHATNEVAALCQKAIWLEQGAIRKIGKAEDVVKAYVSQRDMMQSESYLAREAEGLADSELPPSTIEASRDPDAAMLDYVSEAVRTSGDADTPAVDVARIEQPALAAARDMKPPRRIRDPRLEMLKLTQWRNDIKIPEFGDVTSSHGVGGARIEDVRLEDENGNVLSFIIGGEMVCVTISVRAERFLRSPIVGFQVQDRLGQTLFADNTYLTTVERAFNVKSGEPFEGRFYFQMPLLPVGDYAIRAAVARGSAEDPAMMHVIDPALVFRSMASSVRYGMIGVPMHSIELVRI